RTTERSSGRCAGALLRRCARSNESRPHPRRRRSVPEARKCPNCGSRLTKKARFCPECGVRVEEGGTVIQELPQEETGPVPVEIATAAPRLFGVPPRAAVPALAAPSRALATLPR